MRVAILGNSGSGKPILAKHLTAAASVPLRDLDTIVWEPSVIAVPRPEAHVLEDLEKFCAAGDLLDHRGLLRRRHPRVAPLEARESCS